MSGPKPTRAVRMTMDVVIVLPDFVDSLPIGGEDDVKAIFDAIFPVLAAKVRGGVTGAKATSIKFRLDRRFTEKALATKGPPT